MVTVPVPPAEESEDKFLIVHNVLRVLKKLIGKVSMGIKYDLKNSDIIE